MLQMYAELISKHMVCSTALGKVARQHAILTAHSDLIDCILVYGLVSKRTELKKNITAVIDLSHVTSMVRLHQGVKQKT